LRKKSAVLHGERTKYSIKEGAIVSRGAVGAVSGALVDRIVKLDE